MMSKPDRNYGEFGGVSPRSKLTSLEGATDNGRTPKR